MDRNEVLVKLSAVFHNVFDDDSIVISDQTTARDIDGWDSLANIRLILSIEQEFRLKFDVGEISEFRNVGDLVTAIAGRA